ncbi:MAG: ParB/RepB/Spo0J family partition protein [Eubacteriales bacterium]|nr:ParB/RepB/Spo0J family partition protein [Eubacteriales bacterium]
MKKGLGKGLGALLPFEQEEKDIKELRLNEIDPNTDQPRKAFDDEKIQQLAESIKQHGVVQPIIVRKEKSGYKIVAGERRWRAARLAGLEKIPVIVKDFSDRELMEVSLIENLQREDLNPLEEAQAYWELIKRYKLTQEEISMAIGKSRSAIANSLRLNKLDDAIKKLIFEEKLSEGHARAILSLPDLKTQLQAAETIIKKGMNVRDAENYVRSINEKKHTKKVKNLSEDFLIEIKSIEENLKSLFGTKVSLKPDSKQKGKIQIEYYSDEELERILSMLQNIE